MMIHLFLLCILILGIVGQDIEQCNIEQDERFNCLPNENKLWNKKSECEKLHCCWVEQSSKSESPACYYPKDYGYTVSSSESTEYGIIAALQRNTKYPSHYPEPVDHALLYVVSETENRIHIKIVDKDHKRYEVPINLKEEKISYDKTNYLFEFNKEPFSFKISRKNNPHSVLFNTENSGFVFTDQFLELSTKLPSNVILGLGEHQNVPMSIELNNKRILNWPHDSPNPRGYLNLYSHQPFYMGIEENGNAYGVLFYNSNANEFYTQTNPSLTYRSLGGIFDIYIFMGPTPDLVIQQYTDLVGKPFLPPDWAMGFQLCRWGYNRIENLVSVYNKMKQNHIPYDVQWTDIDVMNNNEIFTYNNVSFKGLPEFIEELHKHNVKYVSMADPAYPSDSIADEESNRLNVAVKQADGVTNARGKQWRNDESFLDVLHPKAREFIHNMLNTWFKQTPLDAVWVDMNEPALTTQHINCNETKYNNPPYEPPVRNDKISDKTLCLDSLFNHTYVHYDVHSIYGYLHSKYVYEEYLKLQKHRTFVISRSTFIGSGQHAGHWGGDNWSTWTDLKSSIWTVAMFNMYGIPYVGVDICGFVSIPTTELCTRWMQMGSFFPFSRNHNFIFMPSQDPGSYDSITINRMRSTLLIRYSLFTHLYSLMFNAHITGAPVIKPLMFNYPADVNTYSIDYQFMWSNTILISPVIERRAKSVHMYLPKDRWYNWYDHSYIDSNGEYIDIPVTMDSIPLHVRGGSVLLLHDPKETIPDTRKTNFKLHIYLDNKKQASGFIYLDEGDEINVVENQHYTHLEFTCQNNLFKSVVLNNGYIIPTVIEEVYIHGITNPLSLIIINGSNEAFEIDNNYVHLSNLHINVNTNFSISWIYQNIHKESITKIIENPIITENDTTIEVLPH